MLNFEELDKNYAVEFDLNKTCIVYNDNGCVRYEQSNKIGYFFF